MTDISLRRAALLGRIWAYRQEHGYPPSLRDLIAPDTYACSSAVRYSVEVLTREGYLEWDREKARTIRLTAKGEALCQ